MSHTVKRESAIHNLEALKRACDRIPGAKYHGKQTVQQYSKEIKGQHKVTLPGYNYPIAIDLESGTISADTYEGRWGNPDLQDQLSQGHGVECAKMEAEEKGYKYEELTLDDGSVKCTLTVGGGQTTLGEGPSPMGGSSAPTL